MNKNTQEMIDKKLQNIPTYNKYILRTYQNDVEFIVIQECWDVSILPVIIGYGVDDCIDSYWMTNQPDVFKLFFGSKLFCKIIHCFSGWIYESYSFSNSETFETKEDAMLYAEKALSQFLMDILKPAILRLDLKAINGGKQ